MLRAGSQNLAAAYVGSVWVDPNTARVLRIEMQARNLPSDFPMDTVETALDYSNVRLGETSFLLPVHAEALGCKRGTSSAATTSLTSATITNSNPRSRFFPIDFARTSHQCATRPCRPKLQSSACKAACAVLQWRFPEEHFIVDSHLGNSPFCDP